MPNILDYLTWRGDVPFSVSPPNEVDNYIHCKIGTLDFTGIVPENELYVPLPQAVEAYFAAGGAEKLGALSSPYIAPMVKRLPETVRFREVMLTGFPPRCTMRKRPSSSPRSRCVCRADSTM